MPTASLRYEGKHFRVYQEEVVVDGSQPVVFEYVWRTDGARIVAREDDRVLLTREYRHELGGIDWRLPGGKVDPNESPQLAAARELREETGYEAAQWQFLWKSTADSTVRYSRHFFVATNLAYVGQATDDGESIENHWVSLSRACELALNGDIREEISALTLLRLHHLGERA